MNNDELPQFNASSVCKKCGYDVILTIYQEDTAHYSCPLGQSLRSNYGPEHLSRICQRCRYLWEEQCL